MHAVAPVEAELALGRVALGVLAELEGVVCPGERRPQVVQQDVDGLELGVLGAGFAATSDDSLVQAGVGGDREAVQPVGDDRQRAQQVRGAELRDRSAPERQRCRADLMRRDGDTYRIRVGAERYEVPRDVMLGR
jgi:hypothetical protein